MASKLSSSLLASLVGVLLLSSSPASASGAAKPAQKTFPTAKAAADALVAAAGTFDLAAL